MLLDRLSGVHFRYFPSTESQINHLTEIRFLQNNIVSEPDILYITNLSFLISSYNGLIPEKIACINDANLECNGDERFQYTDLFIFENLTEVTELFNMLQDIFCYYSTIFNHLLEIVKENRGLDFLLEKIATLLGNPCSIVDRNLKVLAGISYMPNTKNQEFYSDYLKQIQSNGYTFGESKYIEQYLSKNNAIMDKPVYFDKSEDAIFNCISYTISVGNEKIGWLNVYEIEKHFSDITSDLMIFFSEILSLELSKNECYSLNTVTKYEYLCTDLLNGQNLSEEEIEKLSNYLNFPLNNEYFLVVIKPSTHVNDVSKLTHLRARILASTKCNICLLYEYRIVILFESAVNNDSLSKIKKLLTDFNMLAGISNNFTNIKDINKGYAEAKKAIELGIKFKLSGAMFRCMDFPLYHLIDVCAKHEDIRKFCHHSLLQLTEFNPELSNTLYQYLKNGKSQSKTANDLHIQRSSLLYRLKKIEEVLGFSLDDYQSLLHLQLSFEILNYLNFDSCQHNSSSMA